MNNQTSSSSSSSHPTHEESVVSQESIVRFEDDSTLLVGGPGSLITHPSSIQTLIGEVSRPDVAHDIGDFLKTPRQVGLVTWAGTDAANTQLSYLDFPQTLFTTEMVVRKLSDFRFLRPSKLVVKFVLNASQFQVGKLICWWRPFASMSYPRSDSLTAISGYPNVVLDAGISNSAELEIPFVAPQLWYDLKNDTYSYGTIYIHVLNQLKSSAGSTTAHVTVYSWLSDYTVAVRTPNPMATVPAQLQGSEADQVSTRGTISGPLATVGKVAGFVGKLGLGPVSTAANAIEWVSNLTSKAASIFGYSRPQDSSTVSRMIQVPGYGYTNVNGADTGVVLGADALNSIDVDTQVFGTATDEMDIGYVCSKETYLESFQWADTQASGDVLVQYPVTPGMCAQNAATVVQPTMLAFVASLFRHWRGDIQYRFSFVANKFYSGRIGVAFLSGHTSVGSTVNLAAIEAAPKVICDIRETTDCVFSPNFTATTPYLLCRLASRTSTPLDMAYLRNLLSSCGTLVVYVINPLKHPDNVPSSIDINTWISGKNMEFAVPDARIYAPYYPEPEEAELQGNDYVEMHNANPGVVVADHNLVSTPNSMFEAAKLAIGEKITNLRTLTRRFSPIYDGITTSSDPVEFDPMYFGFGGSRVSLYSVGSIYAFYRGGRRFKTFITGEDVVAGTDNTLQCFTRGASTAPFPPTVASGVVPTGLAFEHLAQTKVLPVNEVTLPFYQYTPICLRSTSLTNSRSSLIVSPVYGSLEVKVYTAGGDDFTYGFLIGPPLLSSS